MITEILVSFFIGFLIGGALEYHTCRQIVLDALYNKNCPK